MPGDIVLEYDLIHIDVILILHGQRVTNLKFSSKITSSLEPSVLSLFRCLASTY